MITRAKISAVRASGLRRLLPCFVPDAALIQGRHLIEGGADSSKYGNFKTIPSVIIADKTFDYQNENKV